MNGNRAIKHKVNSTNQANQTLDIFNEF